MVVPATAVVPCTRAEFDALLALLDQEFIFGKGRRLSLAQRFPTVLDRERPDNILLAREHGSAVSALALKPFDWITPERTWRAAMIGMVYTRADRRGQGSASALLQAAQARLARQGADFAVLWTAQPEFYARLGWIGADCGVLGTAEAAGRHATQPAAAPDAATIAIVEKLRQRHAPERVARNEAAYTTLLPPAEQLDLLLGESAYALVGRTQERGYLYEILGDADELPALWLRLSSRYRSLWLNLQLGAPAQRWLSTRSEISWLPQRLAMWLPLTASARAAPFSNWYIPFLDRI